MQKHRKTICIEEKLSMPCSGLCISMIRQLGMSVSALNAIVQDSLVTVENAYQCGHP
jgi:hypothetical protein